MSHYAAHLPDDKNPYNENATFRRFPDGVRLDWVPHLLFLCLHPSPFVAIDALLFRAQFELILFELTQRRNYADILTGVKNLSGTLS